MSLTEEQRAAIRAEAAGGPRATFVTEPRLKGTGKTRRPRNWRGKKKARRKANKADRRRGRKR